MYRTALPGFLLFHLGLGGLVDLAGLVDLYMGGQARAGKRDS